VEVVEWTPKSAPLARFVADTFASSTADGLWIALGRTKTAFWTVEGGLEDDACDDCRHLEVVETRFDGPRKRHVVLGRKDRERLGGEVAATKKHVLHALWAFADSTLPLDELDRTYVLTVGKPSGKDASVDPRFTLEVAYDKAHPLRWDFAAEPFMCWCEYEWKVRTLP
jgi:hypothetical protein